MLEYTSRINTELLDRHVEPLFKTTAIGGFGNILCAFLIYYFLYRSPQQSYSLILSSAIITFSVIRIFVSNRYLACVPGKEVDIRKTRSYIFAHVTLTCFTGICWAAYVLMQLNYDDESLRNLVFLVNFGLIAASVITLAYWLPAYLVYMIPQSVAIIYVFMQLDMEYHFESAVTFVIYSMVMLTISRRFNERHISEMNLFLKNNLLIDNLNQEVAYRKRVQSALEKNKRQLEIMLTEK